MKGIWTRDRTDLLKRLWSEGKTAAAIAASLDGISRAAVLGKIFRLRLDASAVAPPPRKQRGKSLLALDNESCRFPYVPPPQMAI